MASGFVEIDQVLSYNPFPDPLPDTSFVVQYGITCVGPDVASGRTDSAIWVRIDQGDSLQTVQSKIRQAAQDFANNNGFTLPSTQVVIPAYQKG